MAKHALVLESSGHVWPDPLVSAQPSQFCYTAFESDSSQESVKPKPACLAPRASAIKQQGFSEAVVARIDASQSLNQISL